MTDFLFQTWQDVQRSYEAALQWLASLQYDPREWDGLTWLVVAAIALVVVLLLLSAARRRRQGAGPQFLLTNGQIVLLGEAPQAAPADGGRRQPALLQAPAEGEYQLRVTVNNLNSYPVQLLEIAVRTSGGKLPVVADASAVVPPNGAVDVVADMADLPGERGTLELYLYTTKVAPRSMRLIAPLDWEPWNQRYRVRATAQHVEGTRVVASEVRQRQERAAVRRDKVKEWVGTTTKGVAERAGDLRRELAQKREQAARERRSRRELERQEAERQGPFSVPLAPVRSRGAEAADAPERTPGRGPEGAPERAEWPPAQSERAAERDDAVGFDHDEDAREPDDIELTDRKPPPRPRLEFPDEF